jgi:hypothetical protein
MPVLVKFLQMVNELQKESVPHHQETWYYNKFFKFLHLGDKPS